MFNKSLTLVQPHAASSTKTVHKHRAPTDDSVRLLREMENAARAKIVDAVHVGDSNFECVIHTMKKHEDQTMHLLAIFSINGHKMQVRHVEQGLRYDKIVAFKALRDKMAEVIATEVLTAVIDTASL
jgi:hypothetical protein